MSEDPPAEGASAGASTGEEEALLGSDRAREYLLKGALALLALIAVLATIRFYLSAGAAIDRWVTPRYRPVFQAAFNLAVVLAAGIGISAILRRLA